MQKSEERFLSQVGYDGERKEIEKLQESVLESIPGSQSRQAGEAQQGRSARPGKPELREISLATSSFPRRSSDTLLAGNS